VVVIAMLNSVGGSIAMNWRTLREVEGDVQRMREVSDEIVEVVEGVLW